MFFSDDKAALQAVGVHRWVSCMEWQYHGKKEARGDTQPMRAYAHLIVDALKAAGIIFIAVSDLEGHRQRLAATCLLHLRDTHDWGGTSGQICVQTGTQKLGLQSG